MATFTFDGTESQTTNFNVAVDRVIFDLDAENLASISEDRQNNTVTIVATSGAVLTLTNTSLESITTENFRAGVDSDIQFGIGTDGVDTLNGNVLIGLDDDDTVNANSEGALLLGNSGDDTLNADRPDVRMYGGQGSDTINLLPGAVDLADSNSLIVGGLGADDVNVTGAYNGNLTVFGGNEAGDPADMADTISVDLADDGSASIFGNGGNDTIVVTGSGMASVYGGQGNDGITVDAQEAVIFGGLGVDAITVESAGAGAGVGATDEAGTFVVYGGNGSGDAADGRDVISLDLNDDDVASAYGNGGNDVISIISTTDAQLSVFGGQGNDTINGSTTTLATAAVVGDESVIYGGLGDDFISLDVVSSTSSGPFGAGATVGGNVTVFGGNGDGDAADGADQITVELEGDVNGTDPLVAETAVIFGNGGNDTITLVGDGAASVFGGAGDDTIVIGADGSYTLTGGVGEDTFDLSGFTFQPVDVVGVGAVEADEEEDVPFLTDLVFGTDVIDVGADIRVVADQSGSTFNQSTLSDAAEAAFDGAFSGAAVAEGIDAAVLFSYQGDSYVAFGLNGAAGTDEVEGYFKVTGFTGTISVDSFENA